MNKEGSNYSLSMCLIIELVFSVIIVDCNLIFICHHRTQTIINISPQKVPPPTPRQTPISRQHPQRGGPPSPQDAGHRSAPSSPSHQAYQVLGQRVSRVDMREALDFGSVKHQGVIPGGKMYVWCPGKDGKDSKAAQDTWVASHISFRTFIPVVFFFSFGLRDETMLIQKQTQLHS